VEFTFDAELWVWEARLAWTFVTVPAEVSEEVRSLAGGRRPGFGSVRVHVTIGTTRWATSIFPDSGSGCYVLPVKRAIRKAESLDTGDTTTLTLEPAP